jgi:cobalt-zinc-cadmium efflux system outer membrane protein
MKRLLAALSLLVLAGCAGSGDAASEPGAGASVAPATSASTEPPRIDPDRALTVEECVQLAVSSSLTARAFAARLAAAHGAAEAAAAWPNPTFDYHVEDIGTVDNRQRQLLQQELIGYPVLTFWTKGLQADVARADEARSHSEVRDDERQLKLEVGRSFYELLAEDEAVQNEIEAAQVAAKLSAATTKRRALGDASRLDEQRADAETLAARRDLELARHHRVIDGIAFALALGAERPTPVKIASAWPGELPAGIATENTAALVERALTARPDVHEAEAVVLRATKSVDLEDRRAFPLDQLVLTAGPSQGPEGKGVLIDVTAPIPLLDRNDGNRARARAELDSAVVDLEKTRRQVAFEVEAALISLERSRAVLDEFALPIARAREENLEATRKLFTAGEVSYVDLLEAQRDAVGAHRELVDARKEVALARWRLILALGGS